MKFDMFKLLQFIGRYPQHGLNRNVIFPQISLRVKCLTNLATKFLPQTNKMIMKMCRKNPTTEFCEQFIL